MIGKILDSTRESKIATIDSTTSDSSIKCNRSRTTRSNQLWRSPRISGSVLQRCTICGDDFLDLSRHTKCSPCGSDHRCPVCELRFNDSCKLDDHIKRHNLHRERIYCPEKDCNKPFATKQGLDEHIQCIHQGKKTYLPLLSQNLPLLWCLLRQTCQNTHLGQDSGLQNHRCTHEGCTRNFTLRQL